MCVHFADKQFSEEWNKFASEQTEKGIKIGSFRWVLGNLIFGNKYSSKNGRKFGIIVNPMDNNIKAWTAVIIFKLFFNPSVKIIKNLK